MSFRGRGRLSPSRRARGLVLGLSLVALELHLVPAPSGAAVFPEARAAAAGLQAWLDGTRTLDCRFEQRLVSGALGAGLAESGRLRVERPGRMRWDYDPPDPKVALVREERTFLYLPDEGQYLIGELSESEGILPDLLAGRGRLEELFEVSLAKEGDAARTRPWRLRLVPRRAAAGVEELLLSLDGRDFAILAAEVVDGSGSRTEYAFRRVRRNRPFPAGVFEFTPPPGTEVVESR